MKREILFKVYVKLNEQGKEYYSKEEALFIESKMHDGESINLKYESVVFLNENKESVLTIFKNYCEVYELMQFTGLTDKNGVKIFENDIYKDEEEDLWQVIQLECGRYALQMLKNNYIDEFIDWNEVEIIGNIHE